MSWYSVYRSVPMNPFLSEWIILNERQFIHYDSLIHCRTKRFWNESKFKVWHRIRTEWVKLTEFFLFCSSVEWSGHKRTDLTDNNVNPERRSICVQIQRVINAEDLWHIGGSDQQTPGSYSNPGGGSESRHKHSRSVNVTFEPLKKSLNVCKQD